MFSYDLNNKFIRDTLAKRTYIFVAVSSIFIAMRWGGDLPVCVSTPDFLEYIYNVSCGLQSVNNLLFTVSSILHYQ